MTETMSFGAALAAALHDEMSVDENVFVYGLDVPDHKRIFGSTAGLLEAFGPRRCFGTPLSEDAMTGVALGAALNGLRPVHVHIRSDFMLLGINQLANMVSTARYLTAGKLSVPLVIRAVIGRGWGQGAQHSKSLQSVYAHIPGLKVVMPANPQDAYSLLRAAIRDDDPVVFMEHRWCYDIEGPVDRSQQATLGQALVRRHGDALTLVCTSWMNIEALQAAEVLARRGISCEIIDVRTIAPFDIATVVRSVKKTRRCIVLDYDWTFCGFSAEVSAQLHQLCFGVLEQPVVRMGFAHTPCPTTRPLENRFYPSAERIIRQVEQMIGLSPTDLSNDSFACHEQRFKGPF